MSIDGPNVGEHMVAEWIRLNEWVTEHPTATITELASAFGLDEPKQTVKAKANVQVVVSAKPPAEWVLGFLPTGASSVESVATVTYHMVLDLLVTVPVGHDACDGPLSDTITSWFDALQYPEGSFWQFTGHPRCDNCV